MGTTDTVRRMVEFAILTSRLTVRNWKPEDRAPFARLNADPEVMEFLPGPMRSEDSDAAVVRFEDEFTRRGFCPWAVEEHGSGEFIGFVGLHEVPEYLACSPGVEVGWRLARQFWKRGYATEAAAAVLTYAFGELGCDEVVSLTASINVRSRGVMERLGMHRDPSDDFEHPKIAEGNRIRPHVLYRLRADESVQLDAPPRPT